MIIKFPRKFQAGGSLSAKTEYVPIDMKWDDTSKNIKADKPFDVAAENLTADDKYENYKLDGLASDKQSLFNEIESVKARMKPGINDAYSREEYESDAKLLHRLITVDLADNSQKESRYKEVQTAATPAKADLAINNGQAFVFDVITGKYDVVSVDKMLTQRAADKSGKKTSRYIPQSVGTALEMREGNMDFTGRQGGKGQRLEEILHSIQSTKDLQTQLKSAFSGVGSSGNKETNMETIGGAPVNELYNMVAASMGVGNDPKSGKSTLAITSDSVKTNRSQLLSAYNLLKSSVQASGLGETLKRNAYVAYMNEYGDKSEAPDYQTFISEHVDAQLNNAMLAYLKENHADSLGVKTVGGGSSGSSSESKEKYAFNPINEALDMPGELTEFSPSKDGPDSKLKGIAQFRAAKFKDPLLFTSRGYKQAVDDNLPKTVNNNITMQQFSAGSQLSGNLFLLNHENTQVENLADGEGLSQAVLYPGKSPTIWHYMPTIWNQRTQQWRIPWEILLDGTGKNDSTHAKAMIKAEELAIKRTGDPKPKVADIETALADVYDTMKVDPKIGKLGDLKIRNVVQYDLIVPADPKNLLGFYKSNTDSYKSFVTEPSVIKDKGIKAVYESLITPQKEGGIEVDYDGQLYSILAFSVMDVNTSLRDLAGQHYQTNNIEMEKARLYAGETQSQNRNYIAE